MAISTETIIVDAKQILRELIEKIEEPVGGSKKEREKQCKEYDEILAKAKKAAGMEVA